MFLDLWAQILMSISITLSINFIQSQGTDLQLMMQMHIAFGYLVTDKCINDI